MKKNLAFSVFVCIALSSNTFAQETNNNNIHLSFARSFHGTGDLDGIQFTAEYGHYFRKKFEISGNITSTVHWGSFGLLVNGPSGSFDGSYRYGTAGLQCGSQLGFAIIHLPDHILKIQGGSFVRFQTSSASGGYGVTYPPAINYPEPVFTFRQNEKQNLFTIGYVAGLSYMYVTEKNLMLGIKAGFQNDTNGNVISNYGILVGKKLKK